MLVDGIINQSIEELEEGTEKKKLLSIAEPITAVALQKHQ